MLPTAHGGLLPTTTSQSACKWHHAARRVKPSPLLYPILPRTGRAFRFCRHQSNRVHKIRKVTHRQTRFAKRKQARRLYVVKHYVFQLSQACFVALVSAVFKYVIVFAHYHYGNQFGHIPRLYNGAFGCFQQCRVFRLFHSVCVLLEMHHIGCYAVKRVQSRLYYIVLQRFFFNLAFAKETAQAFLVPAHLARNGEVKPCVS